MAFLRADSRDSATTTSKVNRQLPRSGILAQIKSVTRISRQRHKEGRHEANDNALYDSSQTKTARNVLSWKSRSNVTGEELLDVIGKYAGVGVTTLVASGIGAFFGSYLKKKGENFATHEDIDKLTEQVAAVTTTTKQIEAAISNEMWRKQRKAEFQLKAIESVTALTTDFLQRTIADAKYRPDVEWFSAFGVADAAIKALFDDEAYKAFKQLEVLIGPGLGAEPHAGEIVAAWKFAETRNAALKVLYSHVFGGNAPRL